MSKYKLPNGLIIDVDDETGSAVVSGGGGRTVATGSRITPEGITGAAPTGNEPANAIPRPSGQSKNQTDEELRIDSGLAVPSGRTVPGVDSGSQPLSELRPTPETDTPLEREDPIGDTIIGGSLAKPVGAVAGKVIGKATGAAGAAATKLLKPSVEGAAQGAVYSGVPTLIHTGNPVAALKAAGAGAVTGGILGHVAHSGAARALREHSAEATKAAEALESSGAPSPPAPAVPSGPPAYPFPPAISPVDVHLAKLAGPAGEAGAAALKAVVLRPSRETLQAAVAAGIPPAVAVQVARLGAAKVAP